MVQTINEKNYQSFVFFCPDCRQRYYIMSYDQNGDTVRCTNCGKNITIILSNCIHEFSYCLYPKGWKK